MKNIKGEPTRDAIANALEALKDVRLIVGNVSCNDHYFSPRKVVATIVKDNSFVFQQEIK